MKRAIVAMLAGLLLVGLVPSASAAAGPGEVVVETAPAGGGERGVTSVRATPRGLELTWVSPESLPIVDATPEFRLDGQPLGRPTIGADGRTLRLAVDPDMPLELADLEVWLGPRRLDQEGQPVDAGPEGPAEADEPAVTLEVDPGAEGTVPTTTFEYEVEPLPWAEFPRPMEALGRAVLPTGVDDAPLVLILHGRHQPCYRAPDPSHDDTACPGPEAPVPSERGYDYLQQMLASQGVATVSIAANVINGEDFQSPDGGAGARSALVRHHLGLLAGWDADPSHTDFFGRLDMDRVVLIGHSRGGEGVDAAVIESTGAPWTIRGQVLIAPVDFSWQTAGYTPTSVFLPSCDGDVFDLQGQRYVDAAQTLTDDDPTLRSSVLMIGANHNFFNTEWTPGISQAPSFDDWFGGGRDCATSSRRRLSAVEQRRVARTYVGASVDAFLNGTQSSVNVLDAGHVAIPPGVPDARVRTHALGGRRTTVRPGAGATLSGAAEPCASVYGVPVEVDGNTLPPCASPFTSRPVHWSPSDLGFFFSPEPAIVGQLGATARASFAWEGADQVGGLALDSPLDASGNAARIDLRVVADPSLAPPRFAVRLGDGSTSWTSPAVTLQGYPGQAEWAQTVRVPLGSATVDRTAITSIELVSRSGADGRVVLLDASVRRVGLTPVPDLAVPVLTMGEVTADEGDGPGEGTALVPFTLEGDVSQPSAFGVMIDQSSFGGVVGPLLRRVDVPAGVTAGTVEVPFEADTLDELPFKPQQVVASPLFGVATVDNQGNARIADDDADVTLRLTALRSPVDPGHRIGFRLRLSAPRDDYFLGRILAVVEPGVPQIRTTDVPLRWRQVHIPAPAALRPLSRALQHSFEPYFFIQEGRLRDDIVVPTIERQLATTRSMTIRVATTPAATVQLRG